MSSDFFGDVVFDLQVLLMKGSFSLLRLWRERVDENSNKFLIDFRRLRGFGLPFSALWSGNRESLREFRFKELKTLERREEVTGAVFWTSTEVEAWDFFLLEGGVRGQWPNSTVKAVA